MPLKKIKLGSYAAGEIPPPLTHIYKDAARQVINITGWTVLGFYVEGDGDVTGDVAITDGPNGQVTLTWSSEDMQTPGRYQGLIWIANAATNPTIRLASDLIVWDVQDGPGPTPPLT